MGGKRVYRQLCLLVWNNTNLKASAKFIQEAVPVEGFLVLIVQFHAVGDPFQQCFPVNVPDSLRPAHDVMFWCRDHLVGDLERDTPKNI